jgi:hypothetical protein
MDGDQKLASALNETFSSMDRTTKPFPPNLFWNILKQRFPQFGSTSAQGHPQQQVSSEK